MSILKQILSEAWSSVARRSASQPRPDLLHSKPAGSSESDPVPGPAQQPGMKVVILNWKAGENDPFTFVNQTIRQHFHACGKNIEVIEITDATWPARLEQL